MKPKSLKASLGIDHTLRGGEGVIKAINEDAKGVYYVVKMGRSKGTRSVRKEDLVIHRAPQVRRKE